MGSDEPLDPTQGLGPMDFSTFVISMGTSALMHMGAGDGAEPASGPPQLEMARQTIDILVMLEEKTKGNLTDAESELLTSILYQLRVAFVDAS